MLKQRVVTGRQEAVPCRDSSKMGRTGPEGSLIFILLLTLHGKTPSLVTGHAAWKERDSAALLTWKYEANRAVSHGPFMQILH